MANIQDEQNIGEDEGELIKIEELSQNLEVLYKEMEQIRRENLLFESYILRNQKDMPNMEDEKKGKKKQNANKDEKKSILTPEEKYEIAQSESDALKKNIEEGRIKSDSILETLRAILEETDMAITEIRKDAFDFQREILIGGENSRTGKIEAERIQKYFEEKLRQKDALIEKYKAKKSTLESQNIKSYKQIYKKEETGDDLKFIDFHQLQIENKRYVKEIDEKNKKLLDLKMSTGKLSAILIEEKEKLFQEIQQRNVFQKQINEKDSEIKTTFKQIEDVDVEIGDLGELGKLFKKKQEIIKQNPNAPNTMSYVKVKKSCEELQYAIKNLKRKIEIATLASKKSEQQIKQSQYQMYQQQQQYEEQM